MIIYFRLHLQISQNSSKSLQNRKTHRDSQKHESRLFYHFCPFFTVFTAPFFLEKPKIRVLKGGTFRNLSKTRIFRKIHVFNLFS